MLHQGRGIYEAEHAVAKYQSVYQFLPPIVLGVDSDIPDTFPWQGQDFRVRRRDYGSRVVLEHLRAFHTIVNQLAIDLITDQEYLRAVLAFLIRQYFPDALQSLVAIDHAGGVIG